MLVSAGAAYIARQRRSTAQGDARVSSPYQGWIHLKPPPGKCTLASGVVLQEASSPI